METAPTPAGSASPASATIRLHPLDNVVIARTQLMSGTRLAVEGVSVIGLIPPGHKIATSRIEAGQAVRRYGQIIGFAAQDIEPGQHVHTHNLKNGRFCARAYVLRRCKTDRVRGRACHFHGHSAPRWSRCNTQLHRHPDFGELFGHCGARDCRPFPARY
ncbi:UxaA family hydrolase [Undibacterium arcticum]